MDKDIREFGGMSGYTDIGKETSCLDGWYTAEELRYIADEMEGKNIKGTITNEEIDRFGKFTEAQKEIIKEAYSLQRKGFFPNPICALY